MDPQSGTSLASPSPTHHPCNGERLGGLCLRTQRNHTRPRCENMQLKARIQDSVSRVPRERMPPDGYERDALFLSPAFFWDLSFKARPVILCWLKIMDGQTSIIHKWIIHLED